MNTFLTAAAPRAVFERYLTRSEEKRLLAHIGRHAGMYAKRDHAWIRLIRHCGLRLGSLRGLTVGDARTALRTRRIHAGDDHAKGGRGYDTPLNSGAEQALRDLLSVRRAMRCPDDDDAPLICSRLGKAMSERSFQHRLQAWRQSAGLQVDVSPHWLRHSYAQRVIASTEARDPQAVVQVLLGHASRASTTVYTLPTREDIERAAEEACR